MQVRFLVRGHFFRAAFAQAFGDTNQLFQPQKVVLGTSILLPLDGPGLDKLFEPQ